MQHRMAGTIRDIDPYQKSFLTLSCRTKGGAGGPTTTVSTLPQLSAAANISTPLIIVIQGAISGAAKVSVASDKTIIGKSGSCTYFRNAY